jgi:hypothetical protein
LCSTLIVAPFHALQAVEGYPFTHQQELSTHLVSYLSFLFTVMPQAIALLRRCMLSAGHLGNDLAQVCFLNDDGSFTLPSSMQCCAWCIVAHNFCGGRTHKAILTPYDPPA